MNLNAENAVDMGHSLRLRVELGEALPEATPDVAERIARTALLSRREAHRYIDRAQGREVLPAEQAERAHEIIDRFARIPA